jgi:UPF0288 family protein (methanogenesis marker protein 3)
LQKSFLDKENRIETADHEAQISNALMLQQLKSLEKEVGSMKVEMAAKDRQLEMVKKDNAAAQAQA